MRPTENQFLAVDPRRLPSIPDRIVDMMGYATHTPFTGYADGLNPRKAAQRLVQWLSKEVVPEEEVPGFAETSINGKL